MITIVTWFPVLFSLDSQRYGLQIPNLQHYILRIAAMPTLSSPLQWETQG